MGFLGLGHYSTKQQDRKERRLDKWQAKQESKQQNNEAVIARLREKQKTKSKLSNWLTGRNRIISLYDAIEAKKNPIAQSKDVHWGKKPL